MPLEAGIAVVRRNTEEVQNRGHFEVLEELFASQTLVMACLARE